MWAGLINWMDTKTTSDPALEEKVVLELVDQPCSPSSSCSFLNL